MRFICLFLIVASGFSQTVFYPVITDNQFRSFSGGGTNLVIKNGTNAFTGTNNFGSIPIIGNAASLTNFLVSNLVGIIPDSQLSSNIALLNGTNIFSGTNKFDNIITKNIIFDNARITNLYVSSFLLDFDLTSTISQDIDVAFDGAQAGDTILLGIPNGAMTPTVVYTAWVVTNNIIRVRANSLVIGENPPLSLFKITIFKH